MNNDEKEKVIVMLECNITYEKGNHKSRHEAIEAATEAVKFKISGVSINGCYSAECHKNGNIQTINATEN